MQNVDETHHKLSKSEREKWKKGIGKWRRLSDMYPNHEVLGDNPSSIDVIQGGVGDCYFITVLISIATQKEILNRIFITQTPNKAGIYAMKLLVNGECKTIIVDDYIPVYKYASHTPAFMRSDSFNIWAILLEKAWAKINGSYEAITGGHQAEAFSFLTPYPVEVFRSDEQLLDGEMGQGLWEQLLMAFT